MSIKNAITWKNNNITRLEKQLSNQNVFTSSNKALIYGTLEANFEYSHQLHGEKFYVSRVAVPRFSNTIDLVPIVVSEKLLDTDILNSDVCGKVVRIAGQFCSSNQIGEDGLSHLILFLYVKMLNIDYCLIPLTNNNCVYFDAYICKPPKISHNRFAFGY